MTVVMSAGFLAACGTLEGRMKAAASQGAAAGQVAQALAIAEAKPPPIEALPDDCGRRERAGLKPDDTAETIILKYDAAVSRGNARIDRCFALDQARMTARNLPNSKGVADGANAK